MADRAAARIFGKVFTLLAKTPTEENKAFAAELYEETGEFDFASYQMDCDDQLIALDLAKEGVDPRYPDEGVTILYKGRDF